MRILEKKEQLQRDELNFYFLKLAKIWLNFTK